jgi:hypothetical protein
MALDLDLDLDPMAVAVAVAMAVAVVDRHFHNQLISGICQLPYLHVRCTAVLLSDPRVAEC